jgi:thiosulfate/3-mercaptopyruvate sulfurtransferase
MNPLVPVTWLAGRLNDPRAVILDATLPPVGITPPVDTYARYLKIHIPGAVFFDIEALSDSSTPLPHMMPSAEAFSRDMSTLGIDNRMAICIYEQEDVFSAPRAWWMLRTFGAREIYILDGGLRAWVEAGLPTSSGPVRRPASNFHATLEHVAVKDFPQMRQLINERGQILDARSAGRFTGAALEPRAGVSSGHMPGATSVPLTELVEHGRLRPVEQLRQVFEAKGVDLKQPITTTCGSGVTAAAVALGLEIAGADRVSLYDGSWAEYAQHPEAVIEKTA